MVEPNHLKHMLVKLDHFSRDRGENIEYLTPPPRLILEKSFHISVTPFFIVHSNWMILLLGCFTVKK